MNKLFALFRCFSGIFVRLSAEKDLNIRTPEKFAIIILKVEQFGFVTE